MIKLFSVKDFGLLFISMVAIYMLAPSLDRRVGIFISTAFALINIISSHPRVDKPHQIKYFFYILVSIAAYHMLFSDEPWNMVFHGGLFESSPWPLIICSLMMTLNGWLLFDHWQGRTWYAVITLGIQVPIAFYIGGEYLQQTFTNAAHALLWVEHYSGSWQVWQFEWMLTYYLPIFILSRWIKE